MKSSDEPAAGSQGSGADDRRKSDSILLPTIHARRKTLQHVQQDLPGKSIAALTEQRQHLQSMSQQQLRLGGKRVDKLAQMQEDTFYQTLKISLHHSVGSMSISPTCRDVVLAGRQGLVIIDLEDPWLIPRILPHMSKWEVADVQWSPCVSRESWVASTSNQKLLVWNLHYSGAQAIEHVLQAHSRAISDINWSPHHPDLLATCSVDTYVHLWDLRCAGQSHDTTEDGKHMRPANSFTPWNAATTQVKFNRKSEYTLASAHDKDVKIWDIRKGAVPVTSITAHSKKIYGIDWSRQNDHDIVTCSLDKLVKFWNINTPEKEEEVIVTNTPVWRARNLPFGNGVLTMPQRTNSTLYVYSRNRPEAPVHPFEGHTDTVKEFVWRWKGGNGNEGDDREFQLVTWSKDQNLRLWPVSEEIMKAVDHVPSVKKTCYSVPSDAVRPDGTFSSHSFQEEPLENQDTINPLPSFSASVSSVRLTSSSNTTAMTPFRTPAPMAGTAGFSTGHEMAGAYREQRYSINPLLWMQNVKTVGPTSGLRRSATTESTYQSVAEEMSTVLNKFASAGVKTEKVNAALRTCTISLHGPWSDTGVAFLRITIRFSPQYPDNSSPEFEIQKNSMMSIYYRAHMAQDLNALASSYTSQKRWCLEPCIRYLLGETLQEDNAEFGVSNSAGADEASTGYGLQNKNGWGGAGAVDTGDSDDEIFAGPPFIGGVGNGYSAAGTRLSLQSERGIVVDMSSKESADEKVPFPRLCGGVFSGNGQLVCFFSTLRVCDSNRNTSTSKVDDSHKATPGSNTSNNEYFENTYSDFYKHPRTYEQFEEYKEIAAMSRQGRNATVLVGGSGGAFGEYAYDDDPDDIDDGLNNMASLYFKQDDLALSTNDNILYRGTKADRIKHDVLIVDISYMMPYSLSLTAELMVSHSNPVLACAQNAKACELHERRDLSKVWSLAQEMLRECVPLDALEDKEERAGGTLETYKGRKQRISWGIHPLGHKLADHLLQHFIRIGDTQTAALLSCMLGDVTQPRVEHVHTRTQSIGYAPEQAPDGGALDYFSLTASHTSEGYSSQNRGGSAVASTDRTGSGQLSQSYSGRGVGFLSYFWDSERHAIRPGGNKTSKPAEIPKENTTSSPMHVTRPTFFFLSKSGSIRRMPSNTAPGVRHILGGSEGALLTSPTLLTPPTPLGPTVVSDKEGRLLPSGQITLEFTNMEHFDGEKFFVYNETPLLPREGAGQRDTLRKAYGDVLYRMNLLEKRAEILHNVKKTSTGHQERTLQIQIRCYVCGYEIANRDRMCFSCRKLRTQIQCSVCHVLVKGLVNFCLQCQHGGHNAHMKAWFTDDQATCPTGCGCHCLVAMKDMTTEL